MNGIHRKRWIAIGAGILMAAWFTAGWIRDARLPKLTFEPRPFTMRAADFDPIPRIVIHNDTDNEFWYDGRGSIVYRIHYGASWSEPFSAQVDEGGTRFRCTLTPGQRLEENVFPHLISGPLRPRVPYQVGVCLWKPAPTLTRHLNHWFGRWLPDSFGKPREVWVWSETITP